jgi:hypothetical protein
MVRYRNTNGMVVLLLFLTATLINKTPKTHNYDNALALYHLSSKPGLHAPAKCEADHLCRAYKFPLTTIGEKFHRQSVNLAGLVSLFLFIYSPPVIPAPHILPGRTPGYLKTPAERSAQAKYGTISSRFAFQKFSNCFIHRDNNWSNETNLIVSFLLDNISAQSARGPPGPPD